MNKSPRSRLFLFALVITGSFTDIKSVSAFATSTNPTSIASNLSLRNLPPSTKTMADSLRKRGGAATAVKAAPSPAAPVDPTKRIRITAFDSMRFFLCVSIVLGHFISFANPSAFWLRFFSQHNVSVGAFFALSGYVTAYTSTENGKREPSPKLVETPSQKWILSRVFGYLPLHLLVLVLFSPIFLYADVFYSGWLVAGFHGLLSATLTQAWFPLHSEVWNAPTWFLSALTFATALTPFSLPKIAKMTKPQLRKTAAWLWIITLLPKIGYAYDFNAWNIFEGITAPKAHPNLAIFNMLRFSPLALAAEVLIGAVACRLVMLDDAPGEKPVQTNALSTLLPLTGMAALWIARGLGVLDGSDLLVRSILFVPLFLRFLMSAHRNTAKSITDPLVSILSNKFLVALGNLTFPIYIVHGPIGQIFYKKLIATKLFGAVLRGPFNFGLYLSSVLLTAMVLQETFMKSPKVANWSKQAVDKLSSWM